VTGLKRRIVADTAVDSFEQLVGKAAPQKNIALVGFQHIGVVGFVAKGLRIGQKRNHISPRRSSRLGRGFTGHG